MCGQNQHDTGTQLKTVYNHVDFQKNEQKNNHCVFIFHTIAVFGLFFFGRQCRRCITRCTWYNTTTYTIYSQCSQHLHEELATRCGRCTRIITGSIQFWRRSTWCLNDVYTVYTPYYRVYKVYLCASYNKPSTSCNTYCGLCTSTCKKMEIDKKTHCVPITTHV